MPSRRDWRSTMPTLLTSAVIGPSCVRGVIEEANYFIFFANVGPERDGRAPLLADGGDYLFGGGLVAEIVDADMESASGAAVEQWRHRCRGWRR